MTFIAIFSYVDQKCPSYLPPNVFVLSIYQKFSIVIKLATGPAWHSRIEAQTLLLFPSLLFFVFSDPQFVCKEPVSITSFALSSWRNASTTYECFPSRLIHRFRVPESQAPDVISWRRKVIDSDEKLKYEIHTNFLCSFKIRWDRDIGT